MTDPTDPNETDSTLEARLRRLGDIVERETPAASVTALDHELDGSTPLHIVGPDDEVPAPRPDVASKRPSRTRLALAAAALVAVSVIGTVALTRSAEEPVPLWIQAQPTETADDPTINQDWRELRDCESSGVYNLDTGNTFYGAYQFTWDTWQTVGGSGNPATALPYEQDLRAAELFDRRGAEPWPICGRFAIGSMENPLVAAWIHPDDQPDEVIVFFDPSAADEQIAATTEAIESLPWVRGGKQRFVDQSEAWREFQHMFDDEVTRNLVDIEEMPASLRIWTSRRPTLRRPDDPNPLEEIEALPGVFEVVAAPAAGPVTGGGHRVDIPALGVNEQAADQWRIDDLATEVAVVAPTGWQDHHKLAPDMGPIVVASLRSDWQLEDLVVGDAVTIERTASAAPGFDATSVADAEVTELARSVPVDELDLDWLREIDATVVLIADDPNDQRGRIVVLAKVPVPS